MAAGCSHAGSSRGDHYCCRDGHTGGVGFCPAGAEPVRSSRFEWLHHVTKVGSSIVFFAGTALGLVSVLLRLRGAVGVVRAQLQWLLLGALIAVLGAVLGTSGLTGLPMVSELAAALGVIGPPLGIGIAMLRHRLFDVELVLSRTIVYTLLTLLIAGVYAAAVFGVQLIAAGSPLAVVLIAAVALLAATTRSAVQRVVDRALFGHRHNPHAVVSSVGRHMAGIRACRGSLRGWAPRAAVALCGVPRRG